MQSWTMTAAGIQNTTAVADTEAITTLLAKRTSETASKEQERSLTLPACRKRPHHHRGDKREYGFCNHQREDTSRKVSDRAECTEKEREYDSQGNACCRHDGCNLQWAHVSILTGNAQYYNGIIMDGVSASCPSDCGSSDR